MPNEAFLGAWSRELSRAYSPLDPCFSLTMGGFTGPSAYTGQTGKPSPVLAIRTRPPIASICGSGILTGFPSTTAFALALGTD
jgi:hypothetical protein